MLNTKPPWENECATDRQITLLRSEEIASATMAFHFAKPEGLGFTEGQFVDLTLINPPEMDDQGPSRTLTIASAPFEDELMFAVRMRDSDFKRGLKGLHPGGQVLMDHPAGSFTHHSNPTKASVFIAGGIGIAFARGWLPRNFSMGLGLGESGPLIANARKNSRNSSAVPTGKPL